MTVNKKNDSINHCSEIKNLPENLLLFQAPENEFATIKLPLIDFKPYYRGQQLALDAYPLDISAITNIGIKVDNGPYLPDNQPGVSALEIDWIKAIK